MTDEVTKKELPVSGYTLEKVYASLLELRPADTDDDVTDGQNNVQFGWDWRLIEKSMFEVRLHVSVGPSPERQQKAAVHLIGRFGRVGEPTVALKDFVQLQAVAILMPYARQWLSTVTSAGPFDTYYLPSIAVTRLAQGFDFEKTTGAKQLVEESVKARRRTEKALLSAGDGRRKKRAIRKK